MVTDRDLEETLDEAQRCFSELARIFENAMSGEDGVQSLAEQLTRAKGAAEHGSELIEDLRRWLKSREG